MIVDKAAAQAVGGFDPMFTAAGDDVDFSWRLDERELTIASAPAAVVIHERRPTLAAYVEQQRGYGRGEGLLFRKYPLKAGSAGAMYGGATRGSAACLVARAFITALRPRLFQSVYPERRDFAAAAIAAHAAMGRHHNRHDRGRLGERTDGVAGMGRDRTDARERDAYSRAREPAGGARMTLAARALLAIAALAERSPAARRASASMEFRAAGPGLPTTRRRRCAARGRVLVTLAEPLGPGGIEPLLDAMRAASGPQWPRHRSRRSLRSLRSRDRNNTGDARASQRPGTGRWPGRALMARECQPDGASRQRGSDRRIDARYRLLRTGAIAAVGDRSAKRCGASRAALEPLARRAQGGRRRRGGGARHARPRGGRSRLMSTLGLIGEVLRRTRPHLGRLVLAVICVMLAAALEVLKPWPLKVVIDNVLRGVPLSAAWPARASQLSPANLLIAACIGLVVLYIGPRRSSTSSTITFRFRSDSGWSTISAREMFDHLQRLSLSFHRGRPIGDLMVRITYDTFSVQTIAMNGLFPLLSSIVMLAEMFVVMMRIDPELTIVALAVVPFLAALIATASKPIDRIAAAARVKESRLYTVAHRSLAAIHVVQAFTREAESYREFVESSSESLGETLRLYTLQTALRRRGKCADRDRHRGGHLSRRDACDERPTHDWRPDRIRDLSRLALRADQPDVPDLRHGAGRDGGTAAMPGTARDRTRGQGSARSAGARTRARRGRVCGRRIRLRSRPSGAQGRELSRRARRNGRDRRAKRRGQDHDGESAGALL